MNKLDPFQDAQITTLSPDAFKSLADLSKDANSALRRAMTAGLNQPQPEEDQPCAMEAYFKAHKDSPFGGATNAWLVCTCPRCRMRVTL